MIYVRKALESLMCVCGSRLESKLHLALIRVIGGLFEGVYVTFIKCLNEFSSGHQVELKVAVG